MLFELKNYYFRWKNLSTFSTVLKKVGHCIKNAFTPTDPQNNENQFIIGEQIIVDERFAFYTAAKNTVCSEECKMPAKDGLKKRKFQL